MRTIILQLRENEYESNIQKRKYGLREMREIESYVLGLVTYEPQTIYEIHKRSDMGSWSTIKNSLNELLLDGFVSRKIIKGFKRHKTLYQLV